MRLLFAHDNIFYQSLEDGAVYSTGQWQYEHWKGYLEEFDDMLVAARMATLSSSHTGTLSISGGAGISFVSVPSISDPFRLVYNRPRAKNVIREALSQVDALVARLPSEIGLMAISLCRSMGKPWAVVVAGCAFHALWYHGNPIGKLYAPISFMRHKAAIAHSPFASYVTNEFLQERYPSNGRSAAYSDVDLGDPNDTILRDRLSAIEEEKDTFVIGLIGSLSASYKGIDTALLALNQIRETLPNFEFRILGEGDPTSWKKLAQKRGLQDNVKFCGTIPGGEAVRQWLDNVDLYIQPSKTEGLPRALIEAMSRGCPCLGSRVGGIPEILSNDSIHRPGNYYELGALVQRSALDPQWRREQAIRNYNESTKFSRSRLRKIRSEFWNQFSKEVTLYNASPGYV